MRRSCAPHALRPAAIHHSCREAPMLKLSQPSRLLRARLLAVVIAAAALAAVWAQPAGAVASVLYVDNNNPSCSDGGSGTSSVPFCTIGKGASVAAAGQTVQVASGTYSELVTVGHSGSAGSPIVLTAAAGASVTVTGMANGFKVSGKSYITIHGFTVRNTSSYGIYVTGGSSNVTVSGDTVRDTTSYGIHVKDSANVHVSGNDVSGAGQQVSGYTKYGVKFANSTSSLVSGNVSHDNSEAGVFLDNTSDRNVSHDNEDSGLQFYSGSHDNLVVDNLSYSNGDHGIDDLNSTGQRIISNTVYKNVTAGINVEGTSPGATIENNLAVDNGINSPRTKGNIRVDSNSTSRTTVDFNLVYLSVSGQVMYVWGSTKYSSLATFQAATGQEAHGVQADPQWVSAGSGNFHLGSGSS